MRSMFALVPLLLLAAAGPSRAAEFAREGAWHLGGDVYFARSDLDLGSRTVEKTQLELSPELTWFFADRAGLRVAPGVLFQRQAFGFARADQIDVLTPDGDVSIDAGSSDEQALFGLAVGPVYYLPLDGHLHLGLGAHLRYDLEVVAADEDASGFGYGGDASLAYAFGETAVVEFGFRYTDRSLSRKREGFKAEEQDLEDLLLGFRLGLVL